MPSTSAPASAPSNDKGVPSDTPNPTSPDKGKGKVPEAAMEEDDDGEDDDDDDDDDDGDVEGGEGEDDDDEDEDEDMEDAELQDPIDPSAILPRSSRRAPPVDYSSEEARRKAGLTKEELDRGDD